MKFEETYKDYLISNQGLDWGYYVHTDTGMIWFRLLSDCYIYIDYISKRWNIY